ncbi:hypothetical protein SLE2022_235830 [Rubroshorea leprosula]
MERHIVRLLNRVSIISLIMGTIALFFVLKTPETCVPPNIPKSHLRFPKSTCDISSRQHVPLAKKNARLWSSKSWINRVSSFTQFFTQIRDMGHLKTHSKVLCVSAGAGHEVMALSKMGIDDVTGVELVESSPLVSRADPHNLPFFGGAFDLVFSGHFAEALYPARYVEEMERTVRKGGVSVVVVEECASEEVDEIVGLFRSSRLVNAANVTLYGRKVTRIIMRRSRSA